MPHQPQDILRKNIFFGSDESNFINGAQTLLFYHGIIGTLFFFNAFLISNLFLTCFSIIPLWNLKLSSIDLL